MEDRSFDFIRYLEAKKTVDDRALNRAVLDQFSKRLKQKTLHATDTIRLLELAAGIGTMFERLMEWGIIDCAQYTLMDSCLELIAHAKVRLAKWAHRHQYHIEPLSDMCWRLSRGQQRVDLRFHTGDVFAYLEQQQVDSWDVIISHAFLDIIDTGLLIPKVLSVLKRDGIFYFSVNFDGETILLPAIDTQLDEQIIADYHRVMDQQRPEGRHVTGTRTGRYLLTQIPSAGAKIIAAGASDWVVFPHDQKYAEQEDYFLHSIINTISDTLHEQTSYPIKSWLDERHQQINRGELVYIAHQLDVLGEQS